MNKFAQRSVTALAVAGLSLGLGAVGATGVVAQPATETPAVAALPSTINFDATGSITIVKTTAAQSDTPSTGNAITPAPTPALAGVKFDLYKIMDIDNAEQFWTAAGKKISDAGDGTFVASHTTGGDGTVTFTDLPVGLYRVVEDMAPADVSKAAPFLVYLPMTNPEDTTTWNYNVVAYPKNSRTETTKKVIDADRNVGEEITYEITSDIPVVTQNDVTHYEIHDQLDKENVATSPEQISVAVDGTELVAGDYTVTVDAEQKVHVTIEASGLAKLTAAKRANVDAKVVTTIKATVLAVAGTDGIAKNTATVWHNNPYDTSKTDERPSNEVTSYWAKLRVHKVGESEEGLAGAEFEVYRCEDKDRLGEQISIGDTKVWKTDAKGNVVIDGLHVTDLENSTTTIDKTYCLVETKAPADHELNPEPIEIKLVRADLKQLDGDTAAVSHEVTVKNVKSNAPKLPITGGMGIGVIAAAGAAIIAGGAAAAKRRS